MDLFIAKDKFVTASLDFTIQVWEQDKECQWRPGITFGNLTGNQN